MPPNQGERMSAEATVELTWDMAARAGLEDPESHISFSFSCGVHSRGGGGGAMCG